MTRFYTRCSVLALNSAESGLSRKLRFSSPGLLVSINNSSIDCWPIVGLSTLVGRARLAVGESKRNCTIKLSENICCSVLKLYMSNV